MKCSELFVIGGTTTMTTGCCHIEYSVSSLILCKRKRFPYLSLSSIIIINEVDTNPTYSIHPASIRKSHKRKFNWKFVCSIRSVPLFSSCARVCGPFCYVCATQNIAQNTNEIAFDIVYKALFWDQQHGKPVRARAFMCALIEKARIYAHHRSTYRHNVHIRSTLPHNTIRNEFPYRPQKISQEMLSRCANKPKRKQSAVTGCSIWYMVTAETHYSHPKGHWKQRANEWDDDGDGEQEEVETKIAKNWILFEALETLIWTKLPPYGDWAYMYVCMC